MLAIARARLVLLALLLCSTLPALGVVSTAPAAGPAPQGRREVINGYTVLHVSGTPEQMGEQHGRLMREEVRRMVHDLIREGGTISTESYTSLIHGAMRMEDDQPAEYRRELRALSRAAGVKYEDLLAAQLFGDVRRASLCTSFAMFGPATLTGECIAGRNMDYWDNGVGAYGAMLLHVTPDQGVPFVTVTWAGIINGWTAMNRAGIVCSNNTAYGAESQSLDGISTCFMIRKVVQNARTVEEGIGIVEKGPRACGTNLLIAGGTPPAAAIVEFDHTLVAVRRAEDGYVMADNSFRKLYVGEAGPYDWEGSRYCVLRDLIRRNYGRIDRTMNFAAAPGVPIVSMNLHSAMLYPKDLTIRVSMGKSPACEQPYRAFRMTDAGMVSAE